MYLLCSVFFLELFDGLNNLVSWNDGCSTFCISSFPAGVVVYQPVPPVRPKKNMCVYGPPTDPNFWPRP